jgi:hypothetical protein
MYFSNTYRNLKNNPFQLILGVIFIILFFVGLVWIAKGIFSLLALVAPILLIATAVINYRILVEYVKFVFRLFKENILFGILAVLLTVVAFPLVAAFLFAKALLHRKVKQIEKKMESSKGEFIEYEEVVEEKEPEQLILKEPAKKKDNRYDNLFDS